VVERLLLDDNAGDVAKEGDDDVTGNTEFLLEEKEDGIAPKGLNDELFFSSSGFCGLAEVVFHTTPLSHPPSCNPSTSLVFLSFTNRSHILAVFSNVVDSSRIKANSVRRASNAMLSSSAGGVEEFTIASNV
jgi:hypothetical protein